MTGNVAAVSASSSDAGLEAEGRSLAADLWAFTSSTTSSSSLSSSSGSFSFSWYLRKLRFFRSERRLIDKGACSSGSVSVTCTRCDCRVDPRRTAEADLTFPAQLVVEAAGDTGHMAQHAAAQRGSVTCSAHCSSESSAGLQLLAVCMSCEDAYVKLGSERFELAEPAWEPKVCRPADIIAMLARLLLGAPFLAAASTSDMVLKGLADSIRDALA
eukprot:CAMPEP_0197711796 /NCGR_PEP_ID=MMETSP1338-20131121/129634_1 /TAXON_ID=43686 ORGANISM="Pelagodinium beii, Strain RCC1491" /NCGR_SAMPLE_ID=MMETSP1338 /ASSEMBLY_ACC=CAM_ASM_000754 /LENGTH=214 /DNA_ID=CAMNT_0043295731 /DNA_START=1016 /DNA_END=1661 /DNA_ORIENTATION=+